MPDSPSFDRSPPLSGACVAVIALALATLIPAQGLAQLPTAAAGSVAPVPPSLSDDATVKVNFPNTPIQGIIPFYQQLTGKMMILDGSLQGETLRIIGTRPLSKKEALNFIEASLLLNGYAIIDVDHQTVKLIHHMGGKHPSAENIPVFSSIKDLPEGEKIVHFVLPLEHISPEEAVKAFTTVIKLHAYGAITPVTNTSNIIITENTATIRSIFDLAQVIDVPPAEMKDEMIELLRADAESIAEIINEIFERDESEASSQSTAAAQPAAPAVPGQPGAPVSASSSSTNPTAAKVKVIPYRRTNSLLVIARPVDITYIKGLIAKLDREAGAANFLQRKLRYMAVVDFLGVAKNALSRDTDIETDDEGSSGGSSSRRSRLPSTNTPSTDARQASLGGGQGNGQFGGGFGGVGGSGFGGSSASRSSLNEPEEAGAPESVVVGKTLLIADPGSNSLIVNGSPEHVQIIDKLIETMDVRPQQIYISTLIGQLNLGNEYDYGLDMLRALDDFTLRQRPTVERTTNVSVNNNGQTTTGSSTTTTTATGINNTNSGGSLLGTAAGAVTGGLLGNNGSGTGNGSVSTPGTPGLVELPFNLGDFNWNQFNLYGNIGAIGRYLHLLEGNRNFKVLSRPSVYTTNNGKAIISSGQRIAVPVSTLSNLGGGGTVGTTAAVQSAIDYRDVVLKLEVVPLINSDDEVTLRIAQVNDNVTGSQNIGGNNIPTIGTQELVTTVTVKDGSTVVLGGLITERQERSENGVIFLRRIPIIKHLFNRTEIVKNRDELLIFIQPNIIKSGESLGRPNEIEAGRSKAFTETFDFGTRRDQIKRAEPLPEHQQ
jgi:general secretion pathway protein D